MPRAISRLGDGTSEGCRPPLTSLSHSLKAAARPSHDWRTSRSTCGATRARSRTCASTQAVRRPSATPAIGPSTSAPTSTR